MKIKYLTCYHGDIMADEKKCPFCNELNEIDDKFCIYCGKEFSISDNGTDLDSEYNVSNPEEKQTRKKIEFIHCPECYALNHKGDVECEECGYLLNTDITKSFHISKEKKYKRCPKCGNILHPNDKPCNMCGYDFLLYDYDSPVDDDHDFFKEINKFHDYEAYLFRLSEFCMENNIDLSCNGLLTCPRCSHVLSIISPYFIRKHKCPYCGNEFDFNSNEGLYCPKCQRPVEIGQTKCKCGYELDFVTAEEVFCLNCGRPVKEGQTKCKCGYELAEIKCPKCNAYNPYANNFCTSCGTTLRSSDVTFPQTKPRGCDYGKNNEILLDFEFLKKESLKDPYQIDNKIDTQTLKSEYMQTDKILTEISSRWWIVSPFNCKSCQSKIEPIQRDCPKCNITHHNDNHDARVKELKTIENNYIETKRSIDELSNLKWTYKLSEKDRLDYLHSLAPMIGESQLKYRQRLFKEYGENCVILFIIKIQWNRYFENNCMICGSGFQPNNLTCPSCGMKKDVPALSVLLNNDYVEKARFPHQYDAFSENVKNICRDNGGDITHVDYGVVGCPSCSNYFHYLTPNFIDTHRCPHCGAHFEITAKIYQKGGYCDCRCRYYYEELLDSRGAIVGEYVDGGMVDYICLLGHSLGGFCEDYK